MVLECFTRCYPKRCELGVCVDLVFLEKKNICKLAPYTTHCLIDDCVGAAYKQEASVNHLHHVITWDTQIFFVLQTPAFKYNIKTLTGILLRETETLLQRKSKEER